MLVFVVTPLPCLAVTVLIDLLPLGDPSTGVGVDTTFFVRQFYSFMMLTFFAIHQFRIGIRAPRLPIAIAVGYPIVLSAITVAIKYCLIGAVGFPLPFTILAVSPIWMVLTSSAMTFEWKRKSRANLAAAKMVADINKLWLFDALMVFIYPAYFYTFTQLSNDGQTVFSLLLPVIKLCMRNLFARMAEHLKDETPEIVVFNAELFNSLFVSYCMQSSPTFRTTLLITAANVILMAFSLRDIQCARRGLYLLERCIDKERRWSSLCGRISYDVAGGRPSTTLERAGALLQQEDSQASPRVAAIAEVIRLASYHDNEGIKTESSPTQASLTVAKIMAPPSSLWMRYISQKQDRAIVHPTVAESKPSENAITSVPYTLRYTCKVQRLLYMAEFLILLKYVEVMIPLVFTIYLLITYQLPNRDYYAIFDDMDEVQLIQTLANVMFYCFMQLASLLLLIFMLKRMLGVRPITQLVFVLDKQFHWVQTSLIFWVFYNVQASLRHNGYDYSFQFAWLSKGSGSS